MKNINAPLIGGDDTFLAQSHVEDNAWAVHPDGLIHTPISPLDSFTGTTGPDHFTGTTGNDVFDLSQGGNDTASGLAGDDVFIMGSKLTAGDTLDGGDGFDTVTISGNYANLTLGATTFTSIDDLQMAAGSNYNITTNDANVAASQALNVDASQLASTNALTFNGSAETDGFFNVTGGAGNDHITTGSNADFIDASLGGNDVINTGGAATDPNGVDDVYFGAAFTAADQVNGVDGQTEVDLQGDYSAGVVLGANTLTNVGTVFMASAGTSGSFSYNITTNDATVASGSAMTFLLGGNAHAGETLHFDGSAETDGDFLVTGGADNDVLIGGGGDDFFKGKGGDDFIDGGGGKNRATFSDHAAGVTVSLLLQGHAQNTGDGMDTLNHIQDVSGSLGNDVLIGDNNANWLWGEGGSDNLTGNGGNDIIQLGANGGPVGTDVADGGAGVNMLDFDDNGVGSDGVVFSLALQGTQQATGLDNLTASNFTNVTGTSGSDTITGDAQNNTLYGEAGDDSLSGGAGNDTLYGDKAFAAAATGVGGDGQPGAVDPDPGTGGDDVLMGGAGNDILDGGPDGSNTASYADATSGVSVDLTIATSQNVGGGDGHDTLTNIQNLTGSDFGDILKGDNNDNTIDGGAGNDQIYTGGGVDTITGGDGNDILFASGDGTFTFSGGAGTDTINMSLLASGGEIMLANDVENVVGSSFDDTVTLADPTLAIVHNLAGGDGDNSLQGGAAGDKIDGGNGDDTLDITAGGNDAITGDAGNDTIQAGAQFTATDKIDGGADTDFLELNGDYSAGVTFGATTLTNVEQIDLAGGNSYKLVTNDATVAAGATLTINGSALGAGRVVLTFSGTHETNGSFVVRGGQGNDAITTGSGADFIQGGLGADKMNGGTGADTFAYFGVNDSTGLNHDVITGFNGAQDLFQFNSAVNAVDTAVTHGMLRSGTHFDADLAVAVGSGQLAAGDAVVFTADSGALSGHTYLIVDANGTAGYQAGVDFVIELSGASNLASLTTSSFIHHIT